MMLPNSTPHTEHPIPRSHSAMPQEIRRFFEQYRDAFNALDGEAVAKLYAVPSGIAQDAKYEHWPSFKPIKNNMIALCELYRKRGYESASFKLSMFLQQGKDFAVADLQWHIQWSAGQEPWDFNTTYNLVRTGEGWRVLLCTAYAEDKLFQKGAARGDL